MNRLSILIILATLTQAQDATILRPMNQTVIPAGPLTIAAKGPASAKLTLDAKPIESQQPAPGIHTATIKPDPGTHELALGTAKVQFAVGTGPAEWKAFRQHPPTAQCTTCHAIKSGEWAFRTEKLADTCAGCHDLKTFPKTHNHNTEILKDCQECHMPHGSTEKSHLKWNKETACKLCHG